MTTKKQKTTTKEQTREIVLSQNEKRLLTLLGIVLAVWLCYRFIYIPQTEKLASLVGKARAR